MAPRHLLSVYDDDDRAGVRMYADVPAHALRTVQAVLGVQVELGLVSGWRVHPAGAENVADLAFLHGEPSTYDDLQEELEAYTRYGLDGSLMEMRADVLHDRQQHSGGLATYNVGRDFCPLPAELVVLSNPEAGPRGAGRSYGAVTTFNREASPASSPVTVAAAAAASGGGGGGDDDRPLDVMRCQVPSCTQPPGAARHGVICFECGAVEYCTKCWASAMRAAKKDGRRGPACRYCSRR